MDDFSSEKNSAPDNNDNAEVKNDFHLEADASINTEVANNELQPVSQDVMKAPADDIILVEPTSVPEKAFDNSMELGPELIIPTPETTYSEPPKVDSIQASNEPVQDQPPVQLEPVMPVAPVIPETPIIQDTSAVAETSATPEAPVVPVVAVAAAAVSQPFSQTPISIDGEIKPEDIKKSHKNSLKLAILISFGLLLFLIGGSVSAYTFWYSNPKKVVYDAVSSLMTADAVQMSSTTTVTVTPSSSLGGFSVNKITFNTITTNAPSQSMDLSVEVAYSGKTYTVGAKGMYLDNGDMYFRLENILESIEQAFGSQMITQTVKDEISKLQNKWVRFAVSDMAKMSAEATKTYQCVLDTYKSVNKDKAMQNEYVALYEKSPFLTIDEANVQNKDGKYGYSVSIDAKKMVSYGRSISSSDSMKELNKCDTSASSYGDSISDEEAAASISKSTSKLKTVVWVDQWTHSMGKIEFSYVDNESSYGVTVNMDADVKVDNSLKVTAPDQPMSYDDWQAGINKVMQNIYSNY
ncbi:MAG: hypothetical protein WA087_03140 [Candidatus Saccharimonadales bacterium]